MPESVATWSGGSFTPSTTGSGWTVGDITGNNLHTAIAANQFPGPQYASAPVYQWTPGATTEADAISQGRYWYITFSRTDSGAFTPGVLSFDMARGGTNAPRGFAVRSSADSYAANLGAAVLPTQRPDWTHYDIDLSGVGEVTTLTVRVYSYSPTTGSTIEADTVAITATVSTATTYQASGTSAATSGASGSVEKLAAVSGAVAATSSAAGQVTAVAVTSGAVAATSTATGTIAAYLLVSGELAATSATTGNPFALKLASGAIAATSAAMGGAVAIKIANGASNAVATVTGAVTVISGAQTFQSSGTVTAASATSGVVGAVRTMSATSSATSVVAGTTSVIASTSGAVIALATVTGQVTIVNLHSWAPDIRTATIAAHVHLTNVTASPRATTIGASTHTTEVPA